MDARKRMDDLMAITTRLIDVLEREQEILMERRHIDLNGLLDEKETIARVYQARVMGLQEHPDQFDGVAPEERDELRALAQKADNLIRENARMLEAAMYASKRVVDLVAEAVTDASNPTGAYSQRGSAAVASPRSARNSAISLDQTL